MATRSSRLTGWRALTAWASRFGWAASGPRARKRASFTRSRQTSGATMMKDQFRLLMIGAMYENGGNTTHRFLDGHPQMFVYPFESPLGTRLGAENLSWVFPGKYRWPVFDLAATPFQDYKAIIDEECKVRARTPQVSKFRLIRSEEHTSELQSLRHLVC